MSSSSIQERMTTSQKMRTVAFNFAETTLREGEAHATEIADLLRDGGELTNQSTGLTFRFFNLIEDQVANPWWTPGDFPSTTEDNNADNCFGGYCSPIEYDATGTNPTTQRWLDAAVWSDDESSVTLSGMHIAAIEDGISPKKADKVSKN